MCTHCFDQDYYGFPSPTELEKLEELLVLKCASGKINILESDTESGLVNFSMHYQCTTCKEKFILSLPDNAWRGYFLTEEKAIVYHDKMTLANKKGRNGCLFILALLLLLSIYLLMQ